MYLQFSVFLLEGVATSPVARLVSLDVNVDSVSGGTSTATDNDVLAVPLEPDFNDEDIDKEAQFIALLKKKDEDTKLKAKLKKQVITAPSDTADKGTLSPPHVVIIIIIIIIIVYSHKKFTLVVSWYQLFCERLSFLWMREEDTTRRGFPVPRKGG